jgi:putative hydrolase of the HAD superfamily
LISLFFDLDDTLVDSEAAYRAGMRAIGLEPSDETFLRARSLVKADLPLRSPIARSRLLYFKRYLELKSEFTAQRHDQMTEAYEQTVVDEMKTQWHNLGRRDLFQRLLKTTLNIYLVTNESTRFQIKKLRAFDPNGILFKGMITSEECGIEKPDPQIFRLALRRFGTSPENTVMVGDNYKNDIEGAANCGIKTVQTVEFTRPDKTGSQIIERLDDLPEKLKAMV